MERFITKSLKGHDSMQVTVKIYESGKIELISYQTLIARATPEEYDRTKYEVEPMGQFWDGQKVYTPISARHISLFLSEFFENVDYKAFKLSALNSLQFGIPVGTLKKGVNLNYEW